ncbi:MAG: HEAT repeat domain-containing protein [Elusimicrobiaceae bacterium]|nr:HEAT repeat domain-containing protein [Elusimicrobiaceae bacterium]
MSPHSKKTARTVCLTVLLAAAGGVVYKELGYGKKPPQPALELPRDMLFSPERDTGPDCPACMAQYKLEIASPQPGERKNAVEELGGLCEADQSAPLIEKTLGDRDASVKNAAAFALGRIKNAGSVGRLYSVATSDPDTEVRAAAVSALGRIGSPEAAEKLCALLAQPDTELKLLSLYALATVKEPAALKPALAALASPATAEAAASALASMDLPGTAEAAAPLLNAADPVVREAAHDVIEWLILQKSAEAASAIRQNLAALPQDLQTLAQPYLAQF